MTGEEHLKSSKDRALALCATGNLNAAVESMVSDIQKHPDTKFSDKSTTLGFLVLAVLRDVADGNRPAVEQWITGFN